MATPAPSAKPTVVTVQKGDTLSQIALDYLGSASKYKQLAALNGISNPNKISIGQKIKLSGSTSSSSSGTKAKNSNRVSITAFGLSASDDSKLLAAWSWSKSGTENYQVEWLYYAGDKNSSGNAIWLTGNKGTTEDKYSEFSIPDGAKQVKFRVKPVSKTKSTTDKNGKTKETKYFTGEYTAWKYFKKIVPEVPSAPSVEIDGVKLTAELENINTSDLNATHIEFQVIKNNKTKFGAVKRAKINTTSNYVSYTWTVDEGAEYKVRCRSYRDGITSDWSDYSSNAATRPSTPAGFTKCIAKSSSVDGTISVYLEWKSVTAATSYEIEYATNKNYFDLTDQTTTVSVYNVTKWEIFGLATGQEYFFRLRAKNSSNEKSKWSAVSSVVLGEPPAAPTTWSSTTTAMVDDPLYLYWVHNSKDGSSQTWARIALELYVDGDLKQNYTIEQKNSEDIEERDKTSSFDLTAYLQENESSLYSEGLQIKWRVCTSGVTNEFGEWSIVRAIDINAKPSVTLTVTDPNGTIGIDSEELTAYPIMVSATTSPSTQAPIGFHLTITSDDIYETVDDIGNDKMVNTGEEVYSKYFDVNTDLEDVALTAGDVDLENGVSYTLTCIASMDSGLTAEESLTFTVAWDEIAYIPNAEIVYDPETVITHIHPYCNEYTSTFYKVIKSFNRYTLTNETTSITIGDPVNGVFTTTGEQVYFGTTDVEIDENGNVTGGEEVYYYEEQTGTPIEGVLLSVYRREFDGSFTELATGIDNTKNTFITDPHPALDYARYRIVATTQSTGAVGFYDVPGYAIDEKSVIIQWNEEWSNFDVTSDDPQEEPAWSGSLLKLPYNVDVSDSYRPDASLIEYVGRKRPVSYYGTQLGESSTWNVVIEKDDEETLYALRRLAIWGGDAYVREPSGTGYWANVVVSFSQKHLDLTIPVTLTLTRVEGGI